MENDESKSRNAQRSLDKYLDKARPFLGATIQKNCKAKVSPVLSPPPVPMPLVRMGTLIGKTRYRRAIYSDAICCYPLSC
jgi:hypothetical protein